MMPACAHHDLLRQRRCSIGRLSVLLRLRPVRCMHCQQRLWRYAGFWPLDLGLLALALGFWFTRMA